MTATSSSTTASACTYVIGEDGVARLDRTHEQAWTGLLRAHRRLTRQLEAALQERHQLSLSALELLGRLAAARQQQLRIARLAEQAELSLSRTSRILDTLERRGLVERHPCAEDSRASNVRLTEAGLGLARAAQADHLAEIQLRFFDPLTARQIRALAAAFAQLVPLLEPDRAR
jgi:DNA-binding MarR family transcriptional regulator